MCINNNPWWYQLIQYLIVPLGFFVLNLLLHKFTSKSYKKYKWKWIIVSITLSILWIIGKWQIVNGC